MIMDRTGLFSDAQAITATAASTNLIDLGPIGSGVTRDIGHGTEVPIAIAITQAFNNMTSLTISIETDDNAAFSSASTVWTSPAYTLAQINAAAAGTKYLLPDGMPGGTAERYVRLKYTVAGTAPTTGKITAGIAASRQSA